MVLVFVMPIGLENIGWKMYMVNGSWDIIVIVLIVSLSLFVSMYFKCVSLVMPSLNVIRPSIGSRPKTRA